MNAAQIAAVMTAILTAVFLPIAMSGAFGKAEQEKARARRMADHRMNARLLRMDI
jgi:hypothetical protein